ncbi:divergent protein kinase domain 1A-like [Haliotis rufescens]|uniref:divergent protein kinase domain 1A-like n=1 Tax=Haliotis rufescens TaxID=6454 RepID=UPI00201F5E8C|nr:divergent protein kinase domain 1A-like [Haliotis rufescens]
MFSCPIRLRMRRRKRVRTLLLSALDRLISCLEFCQELSQGPWKMWLFVVLMLGLLYASVWRIFFYDPCDSSLIRKQLCAQYHAGEVAGTLCYPMCVQKVQFFSYCDATEEEKSFVWHQTKFKVQMIDESVAWWRLKEGTLISEFRGQVSSFLQLKLGHSTYEDLTDKLLLYADFNEDGKLSLAEAQSLWRLIHIQEFLLLYIFQKSSTFPNINGTCGHFYGFQHTPIPRLYDKQPNSWLSKLFTNSYKWEFPRWAKRARVTLGIVEFSMDIYEEQGTKFLMCDISPVNFGITFDYEAMLTGTKDIASAYSIGTLLQNRTCYSDSDCVYSRHCRSMCDRKGRCSGEITHPTLWFVCDIIRDYLLFDAPKHLYYELKRLLSKCSFLSMKGDNPDLKHAVVYHDLKSFLWKEIQYSPDA